MAIVEGATGLFYWSYGVRALEWVKDPVQHAALYQELIDVTTEIKSLEPVLLSPDAPVISANSAAGTVFTKTEDRRRRHPLPVRVQLHRVAGHCASLRWPALRPASSITTLERIARPIPARLSPAYFSRTRRTSFW